jgi:hypothetical protein
MAPYVTQKQATPADLEATISAKGHGFPLSLFSPQRVAGGVSVLVKGRRFTIPHAFFIPQAPGHVFARGAYAGKSGGLLPTGEDFGRFVFGKKRLPISELYTLNPADAMSNTEVVQAMNDRVDEQAADVLRHELGFAIGSA